MLPRYVDESIESAILPAEVTKIALRLRRLVEECVPCELDEAQITKAHSRVITEKVIQAAREAGGADHRACVVFGLLVNRRWWTRQSLRELWDADLHRVRAVACEVMAKNLCVGSRSDGGVSYSMLTRDRIEHEEDTTFLLQSVLLKRYAILVDGTPTPATNVIEKAVDLHALRVIGSSGYQQCISHLWKGWLVQDENDPASFVDVRKSQLSSSRRVEGVCFVPTREACPSRLTDFLPHAVQAEG